MNSTDLTSAYDGQNCLHIRCISTQLWRVYWSCFFEDDCLLLHPLLLFRLVALAVCDWVTARGLMTRFVRPTVQKLLETSVAWWVWFWLLFSVGWATTTSAPQAFTAYLCLPLFLYAHTVSLIRAYCLASFIVFKVCCNGVCWLVFWFFSFYNHWSCFSWDPSILSPSEWRSLNPEHRVECQSASMLCCFRTFQESQSAVLINHTFLQNYSTGKELEKAM